MFRTTRTLKSWISFPTILFLLVFFSLTYFAQINKSNAAPVTPPRENGQTLKRDETKKFVDTFETLDKSRWLVAHDWSNGSYMVNDWQKSQATLNSGLELTLATSAKDKFPFSSGEVQSRKTYGYGLYETRMRAAKGSGLVTGFFTYTGPPFGKPWNEIDVEILGRDTNKVTFTYFYHGEKVTHVHKLGFDASKNSHLYAFEWNPNSIKWYIDGQVVYEVTGKDLPLPNEKQKIMMSIWGSKTLTSWVGKFDESSLPASAIFKCVSYNPNPRLAKGCE